MEHWGYPSVFIFQLFDLICNEIVKCSREVNFTIVFSFGSLEVTTAFCNAIKYEIKARRTVLRAFLKRLFAR